MNLNRSSIVFDVLFHVCVLTLILFEAEFGFGDPLLLLPYNPLSSVLDLVALSIFRVRYQNPQLVIFSILFAETKLVAGLLCESDIELNNYIAIALASFVICCIRFACIRDPTDSTPTQKITWTRLFRFASGHWTRLVVGISVLFIRLPFSLAVPHYVSEGIGALIERDSDRLRYACIALFVSGTMDAILDFWCVYIFATAQQEIVFSMRTALFRSILVHPLSFFDVTAVGELQSRLNADTAEMANDLSWVFRFAIEALVRIAGVVAYMFYSSWRLAVLVLYIVPVNAIVNTYFGQWMSSNAKKGQDLLAVSNTIANESFGAIQTVKSFHGERKSLLRYTESLTQYKSLLYKSAIISATYYMFVSTFLMNTVMQTAIVGYGGYLAWNGFIATERLVSFMLYRGQLQDYCASLMNTYVNLVKCAGVSDKVFALLGSDRTDLELITSEPGEEESVMQQIAPRGSAPPSIVFEHVYHTYASRPQVPVMNNVSFRVESGSCTAIVGHSGSGKSSTLSLLLGLYHQNGGRISINNRSIDTIPMSVLRGQLITLVSQEPVLFRGTLRDNILYSVPDRRLSNLPESELDSMIAHAMNVACISEFVDQLPEKLNTPIGDRGVTLSGGQKQRIAIARAILANPPILVLDEAMSALDPESEESVQRALKSAIQSRTTIMVSHRISTVIDSADHCIVMHKGVVVEAGSPRELLANPAVGKEVSLKLLHDIQQRNRN